MKWDPIEKDIRLAKSSRTVSGTHQSVEDVTARLKQLAAPDAQDVQFVSRKRREKK